ncbi:hypothetical protein BJD16_00970 [Aeromonas sobria]|uniref:Uncharacterized protein n=2 Tax=Aeromonas sobria TaxID=646 RepID=A0A1S2D9P1_AERSO|nr:hypothetical protein BJD16_00970 [Aeromonas sobria]
MKKSMIVMASGLVLMSAAANAALPTTQAAETLTWKGLVPFSVATDDLMITGDLGGPIRAGFLNVEKDGTFSSTAINVEAHDNTGDAASPAAGDPIAGDVVWGLASYAIDASTTDMSGANVKFVADGSALDIGTPLTEDYALAVNVSNDLAITDIAPGERIQVSAVVTAELPILP